MLSEHTHRLRVRIRILAAALAMPATLLSLVPLRALLLTAALSRRSRPGNGRCLTRSCPCVALVAHRALAGTLGHFLLGFDQIIISRSDAVVAEQAVGVRDGTQRCLHGVVVVQSDARLDVVLLRLLRRLGR